MPFQPFTEDAPHTPPYPDSETARRMNVPTAPPAQPSAPEPYVPQPTPVGPMVSFSEPYDPSRQAQDAPGVQIPVQQPVPQQTAPVPPLPQEDGPAIIPETAPIPPAPDRASRPAEKAETAPRQSFRVHKPRSSSLSESLLEGINALLNNNNK